MRKPIVNYLARSPFSTFVLMTSFFLMFGYFSLNIIDLLQANIKLINAFGLMAIADGAAQQLVEIVLSGFASILFFTGWKLCERLLIDWITRD